MNRALYNSMRDPSILLALSPEELGGKILFALHRGKLPMFMLHFVEEQLYPRSHPDGAYPDNSRSEVMHAVREAWSWLEASGLIIPAEGANGQNGWRVLTRRAQKFEDEQDFSGFISTRQLPREILHPAIAERVWHAFIRADYDEAVHKAFKAVEIAVREACGYDETEFGVPMLRKAFNSENGPLTDMSLPKPEREAVPHLFAGAYGRFRNPVSHRHVGLDDPVQAIEIILLASHLLRIVDLNKST